MSENNDSREAVSRDDRAHWVQSTQNSGETQVEVQRHAWFEAEYRWATPLSLVMATVFVVASVLYWLPDNDGGIGHNLQTSFAELLSAGPLPTPALTSKWNEVSPGGANVAEEPAARLAFANGARLARGRIGMAVAEDKGREPIPPETVLDEIFFEAGQWNQILWVASQRKPELASDFWNRQNESVGKLRAILPNDGTVETAAIQSHLTAVRDLLGNLANNPADPNGLAELQQQTLALHRTLTIVNPKP